MWNSGQNPLPPGDPRRILKYALGLGAGLLVLWIFVLAQSENRSRSHSIEEQARIDSLRVALGRDLQPIKEEDSGTFFMNALPTFLLLFGTIVIAYLYFRKKGPATNASNSFFKPIISQRLPTGQEIQVVEINNEFWVLGCTPSQVNLLHRFSKTEWDLIAIEETVEKPASFSTLLSNIQKKK